MNFALQSLWYHRWTGFSVFLGVICATAVLTGALLVGDSMRGSLRALTLDRLGKIDVALQSTLQSQGFFEPPSEFLTGKLPLPWVSCTPAIFVTGAVSADGTFSQTQILGLETQNRDAQRNATANRALAEKLNVKEGDTISLRLLSPQTIPAESSLGRRNDLVVRAQIRVAKIVPNEGIGRFSFKADQQAQPLLLVPLDWLQERLNMPGKINTVFFKTENAGVVSKPEQRAELEKMFQPSLDNLGLSITEKNGTAYITSHRMMFTDSQAAEIQRVFPNAKPGLLYLATSITATKNGREVPYSTVYACDIATNEPGLVSPDTDRVDGIVLNQWAVDDLDVQLGDEIELSWLDPENVQVTPSEKFVLTKILPMDGLGADANLVPEVQGITDEAAIADWDPPFPFDAKKIRKTDEDYWDKHRAAPKAFVSLETGQKLWGSQFGKVTTFLVESRERKAESGELSPSIFGLHFIPLKEQGLAASSGTTPFSVLFLSFSFFIIAAALMLVAMLFRLSVEMKAKSIGILLTMGWTPRQVTKLLLAEGFIISVTGSLLGVFFGMFYAKIMVYGLTTWWVDAITVPFLGLYFTPTSLLIGFSCGTAMAMLTIFVTLRNIKRTSIKTLLGGDFFVQKKVQKKDDKQITIKWYTKLLLAFHSLVQLTGLILTCCILGFVAMLTGSGLFLFFAGLFILFHALVFFYNDFDRYKKDSAPLRSLFSLAWFNIARKTGRSILFIGLVASTVFLVLSISAFRLEPGAYNQINYNFIAETALPVYYDISTAAGLEELGIQEEQKNYLHKNICSIASCRVHGGDNASCLNLYQSTSPRVLGIPVQEMVKHDFNTDWTLLNKPVYHDPDNVPRVPVILDVNTAMYSLHLYGGLGETFLRTEPGGSVLRCEVVGLLQNSMFQGDILIGEENFVKLFPESGGYRMFLFDIVPPHPNPLPDGEGNAFFAWVKVFYDLRGDVDDRTIKILYDLLGDYGFQGETTADRLRKLFAVQNTYLSTFQSLGGIGLMLGIFGLTVIQLRNIFERRKELALMQAIGFAPSRIMLLLLCESFFLLLISLGLALVASLIALLPFLLGWAHHQASPAAIFVQFLWLLGGMIAIALASNVVTVRGVLKIPAARELAEER